MVGDSSDVSWSINATDELSWTLGYFGELYEYKTSNKQVTSAFLVSYMFWKCPWKQWKCCAFVSEAD